MSVTTKRIVIAVIIVLALYLAFGTLISLRKYWFTPPELAADNYLRALQERDTAVIYLYSDMLGPRLMDMMEKSRMTDEERRQLWAKDYTRWRSEFQRGAKAMDSLRRERELITGQVQYVRVSPQEYKAEVKQGEEINLLSYVDLPGEIHHRYYRLTFPSTEQAPPVSVLDNIRTGAQRRIKSVVIRIRVRRRPDANAFASLIMEWDWLDNVSFLFPFAAWVPHQDPSDAWMAGLSFDVDKLTLETF